mgnify:CR=1 FL=1|jgi:hypothetical protein
MKERRKEVLTIMFLLVNDEYGQEVAAVYYDEKEENFKDVFDAARAKYPDNAFTVSSASATTSAPPAPEMSDDEKKAAALAELDSHYTSDKQELSTQYLDAAMTGDNDTMTAIKAELAALNEKYDADYAALNE